MGDLFNWNTSDDELREYKDESSEDPETYQRHSSYYQNITPRRMDSYYGSDGDLYSRVHDSRSRINDSRSRINNTTTNRSERISETTNRSERISETTNWDEYEYESESLSSETKELMESFIPSDEDDLSKSRIYGDLNDPIMCNVIEEYKKHDDISPNDPLMEVYEMILELKTEMDTKFSRLEHKIESLEEKMTSINSMFYQ